MLLAASTVPRHTSAPTMHLISSHTYTTPTTERLPPPRSKVINRSLIAQICKHLDHQKGFTL